MTKSKLACYVREQFGLELQELIRQKVEVEALHDYEIASILNVSANSIATYRKDYGIKKAGFLIRFERTYGKGSLEAFKESIEDPCKSLADVARYFKFSREYARQVCNKIYGCSYTEVCKRKRQVRKKKRLAPRKKESKQVENLIDILKKMKSIGLRTNIAVRGRQRTILTDGGKIALRSTSAPVVFGNKKYFRFNIAKSHQGHFDFYLCHCKNEKDDLHFIIPSDAMPRSIVSLLPHATPDESKYARFKEAWHLLVHNSSKDMRQAH